MKQRDFTSAMAKEALLKDKDKFCGECCWFYAEDTYGYGVCPFRFAELQRCSDKCPIGEKYVSIKEMRHHMAVLLQGVRNAADPVHRNRPDDRDLVIASSFAYKYMKVFNEL